jgi:hypothetical protein
MSEIPTIEEWEQMATEFFVEAIKPNDKYEYPQGVYIAQRGDVERPSWVVFLNPSANEIFPYVFVLNRKGEWEYEPLPDAQSMSFVQRTHYGSKEEAWEVYQKAREVLVEGEEGDRDWVYNREGD